MLLLVSFPSFAFGRCGFVQISKIPSMLCWVHLGGISCYLWLPLQMGLFENWGGPQICLRSKMRMIPPPKIVGVLPTFSDQPILSLFSLLNFFKVWCS